MPTSTNTFLLTRWHHQSLVSEVRGGGRGVAGATLSLRGQECVFFLGGGGKVPTPRRTISTGGFSGYLVGSGKQEACGGGGREWRLERAGMGPLPTPRTLGDHLTPPPFSSSPPPEGEHAPLPYLEIVFISFHRQGPPPVPTRLHADGGRVATGAGAARRLPPAPAALRGGRGRHDDRGTQATGEGKAGAAPTRAAARGGAGARGEGRGRERLA